MSAHHQRLPVCGHCCAWCLIGGVAACSCACVRVCVCVCVRACVLVLVLVLVVWAWLPQTRADDRVQAV